MDWWSSVVDGVQTFGMGLSTGVKWIWNNGALNKITLGLFTYAANTSFQVLEEGLALRKAVPTLFYNPEAQKIVYGMGYILICDVVPLVGLNWANTCTQNYFRKGHEQDDWHTPYSAFLAVLQVANYAVTAFTWRQGVKALIRNTIIDSLGPTAFNSNKITTPKSLCTELQCNFKRKAKGMLREPLILAANDIFVLLINLLPYIGAPTATVLNIFFHGRYQYRLTTPERCERHKAMMQEEVLALGLTYEVSTRLMNYLLESTIGIPPYLHHRTLCHLLLLLHINLVAHSNLPLVEDKDATLFIDPLNVYERVCRFFADVLFAGLMKRIPIDFKQEKDAAPFISLSSALQFGTRLFNSDKEIEKEPLVPGFFAKSAHLMRTVCLPALLHSPNDFIRDPIVTLYWPTIRQGGIAATEFIESVGQSKKIQILNWAPKSVASALDLKFGIPKKVTRTALMLSGEQDFWNLIDAIKKWFERHNVKIDVVLAENTRGIPLARNKLITLPKPVDLTPITPGQLLLSDRTNNTAVASAVELLPRNKEENKTVATASELIPENKTVENILVSSSADSLFSTRRLKRKNIEHCEDNKSLNL